jgi:hypothetical protein
MYFVPNMVGEKWIWPSDGRKVRADDLIVELRDLVIPWLTDPLLKMMW